MSGFVSAKPEMGGVCPWCERLARNGCAPEVCGHLGGGSMAVAAQEAVERWKAEAARKRELALADTLPAPGGCYRCNGSGGCRDCG